MIHRIYHRVLLCLFLASPAAAETCDIDLAAIQARIADLDPRYGTVLSDIRCDAPTIPAHQLLCLSAETAGDGLWQMARLDTLAWVYAYENATGSAVDLATPPMDNGFIATRDACTDVDCLCAVLMDHTNGSLGGTSPYGQ
ncbi:MAG: hypothetical protein MUD11_04660 [Rhodobacteraceae bacterium]|nr:hypothetical protein [Paracoccaceae bacterium]